MTKWLEDEISWTKLCIRDSWRFWLVMIVGVCIFLGLIVFLCEKPVCGKDVKTDVDGITKIVEIETHGEVHEYLFYHQMYRGSLCHLPNCKYCKEYKER